ncbi:hypothetical protein P7D33_08550 [Lactococcus petauri]|uniref:hypothetical protein n=1 Tax=Lactococcus petauri TaxID=1940789 RepID=UPI0028903881|nr:hypothetical protein [Lactococcus petauri]MDT2620873.1 hypothetical protein [Lactococcus petauri]
MFKRKTRKKELFKEIEELQKKLAFYRLVSKVAQITIPEEQTHKYGCDFHVNTIEEDIKRWPDLEDNQFFYELYVQTRTNKQLIEYCQPVVVSPRVSEMFKKHFFYTRSNGPWKDEHHRQLSRYTKGLSDVLDEVVEKSPGIGLSAFIENKVIRAWKYGFTTKEEEAKNGK